MHFSIKIYVICYLFFESQSTTGDDTPIPPRGRYLVPVRTEGGGGFPPPTFNYWCDNDNDGYAKDGERDGQCSRVGEV